MMFVVAPLVFIAAFALAAAVIGLTVAPQWRRMVRLVRGDTAGFAPLATLAQAERRIAVRRWSAGSPVPVLVQHSRAAA